jgi:tetratricopeptide (TPR) repeat protein
MPDEKDIIKLLDKGNLDGAFDLVDEMKDKKSMAVLLSDYAAIIARHYGLHGIVERLLKKAVELDPNSAGIHFNLGVLYTEPEVVIEDEKKIALAEEHYLRAIELDSGNLKAHYNLGLLYAYTGRAEEAREQYAKVLELDPDNIDKYDVLDGLISQVDV